MAGLDIPRAEPFAFKGADGDNVAGWLVKPPGFDPSKKYPVVFLIHGGPPRRLARRVAQPVELRPLRPPPGYAVVAINPRGSTGFGQKFTDQISQDWTGRVYEDLMKGLDHAIKTYPFLDQTRMAAAGGSYGGFMVNWIAGHSDRFKALISHAGVFDLTSMYFTTEELWFAEWEFGGLPWESPKIYLDQAPSAFVPELQNAHPRHPRSQRLPGARRPGVRHVHRTPTQRRPQPLCLLPRRRPLDRQTPPIESSGGTKSTAG